MIKKAYDLTDTLHIYTRVSTSAQEEGTSLDTQRELGIKRAEELGFEYRVWNEGGQSSSHDDLANRPHLMMLLDEISKGNARHVFVYNTDRLSRNEQTWGVIRLNLIKNNVQLHTSSGLFNLSNSSDKMLLQIMSAVSEYDNSLRAERSRLGKFKKIQQGFWLGGPPPFGYKIEEKKLVPNEIEVKWVQFIFQSYADNMTVRWIKNELLKNGVKTRRGNSVWSLGSIEKMLLNTHYGGFYYVKDKKSEKSYRVECPEIVSPTLILQVQKIKEQRTRQTRVQESNLTNFYLLRDLLFCAQCGSRYSARLYPKQYRSNYYCPRLERNFVNDKTQKVVKCDNRRYLKIEETNSLVWDVVVKVLNKSYLFKEEIKRQVLDDSVTHNDSKDEIKKLRSKIKKLDNDYADATKSIVNLETDSILKRRNNVEIELILKSIEDYRMNVNAQREQLKKQVYAIENQSNWIDWMSQFGERINKLSELTEEEKKAFLKGVVDKIEVSTLDTHMHKLDIKFRIPYVNDKLQWKNKSDKSKGYKIVEGQREISVDLDLSKK
jgi:DNA invertase Pin-like site-specific DNA recombinase